MKSSRFLHPVPEHEIVATPKERLVRGARNLGVGAAVLAAAAVLAPRVADFFDGVTDRGWGDVETAYGAAATACEPMRKHVEDRVSNEVGSVIGTNPESVAAISDITAEVRGCLVSQGVSSLEADRLGLLVSEPGIMEPRIVTYSVASEALVGGSDATDRL